MKNKFNIDIINCFKGQINKMVKIGLLETQIIENDVTIRLSKKGLDLANLVWEEFI